VSVSKLESNGYLLTINQGAILSHLGLHILIS